MTTSLADITPESRGIEKGVENLIETLINETFQIDIETEHDYEVAYAHISNCIIKSLEGKL